MPLLEFAKKTHRPLVIFAENFEAEPLTTMVINKLKNNLSIVAVKTPIFDGSDILNDIATSTGATVLS